MAKRGNKRQKTDGDIQNARKVTSSSMTQPLGAVPIPHASDSDSDKDDEERRLESFLFDKPFMPKGTKKGKEKEMGIGDDVTEEETNEMYHMLDKDLFFFDESIPQQDKDRDISNSPFLSEDEEDASESREAMDVDEDDEEDDDENEDEDGDENENELDDEEELYAPDVKKTASPESPHKDIFSRKSGRKPAWIDPSDNNISISLAEDTRLRKLRDSAGEDVINGKQYETKLRRQYEKVNPTPSWASAARKKLHGAKRRRSSSSTSSSIEDPISSLFQSSGNIAEDTTISADRPVPLPPTTLSIERLRDANQSATTEGEVKMVRFHPSPTVPMLLTAGTDRRLRLFNIDGLTNPLIQTVHIPSLPLTTAKFHPSGTSILLTGPRPYYYTFDLQSGATSQSPRGLWSGTGNGRGKEGDRSLECFEFSPDGKMVAIAGRNGYVHLLDWTFGGASGQLIGSIKMNGSVKDLVWSTGPSSMGGQGGQELMTLSQDGEVYIWDIRTRRCMRKWKDESSFGGTVLDRSRNGKYHAIGSSTGIVNIYDQEACNPSSNLSSPSALRAIKNIVTPITSTRFDSSSQLLAIASKSKKDQLRLVRISFPNLASDLSLTLWTKVHLSSLTTYANWPTSGTPLGHVTSVDFSRGSEYLAIGNSKGRVLLYNLRHFGSH
ncbi:hypothetical protein FRC02_000723 [Tulasnella sp. 418]|nr:hypothetical protein FRC02_000723 [Tulasnella sp. 418]